MSYIKRSYISCQELYGQHIPICTDKASILKEDGTNCMLTVDLNYLKYFPEGSSYVVLVYLEIIYCKFGFFFNLNIATGRVLKY